MKRRDAAYLLLILVFISGCSASGKSVSTSSADWAYSFVIWNDDLYEVLEDEVRPEDIGEEIGKITQYSDAEGIYSNGFSNKFPEGTELYEIEGVEPSEYIAVKAGEQQYLKTKDHGAYAAN
ncbi:hypothetical protein [Paenibacillus sp. GCM10023250]|uniref:hypothetical protein n=1 Tax=Paenibacillus sp. GCM10023250 TaxID=3252648 RepID=UPI0036125694